MGNVNEIIYKPISAIGGIHGVSINLPEFDDIIDYEEGNIILNRGYPRFVTHPFVREFEQFYKDLYGAKEALAFQSFESACFLLLDFFTNSNAHFHLPDSNELKLFELLKKKNSQISVSLTQKHTDFIIINSDNANKRLDDLNPIKLGIYRNIHDLTSVDFVGLDFCVMKSLNRDIGILLIMNLKYFEDLVLFRRHTGLISSSRKICNQESHFSDTSKILEERIKTRLARLENGNSENVYLTPSGMAAVFAALYSCISERKSRFIALGSLYVDTMRILEKWPERYGMEKTKFITENFEEELEKSVNENTAGIFFEIPTNPLLQVFDIEKIVNLADKFGVPVICDNTIATPYNFNPLNFGIDIVIHSTTKFLNGMNNHLGGFLLVNNKDIKRKIDNFINISVLSMAFDDMKILDENLSQFESRMRIINSNSLHVAKFLENHKKIEKVYYPLLKTHENYNLASTYLTGGSGLISFTLKNSNHENASNFYNNIAYPILKGPSLGSEQSLLSPYVMMAHYHDDKDLLRERGLDFYLMRLSVGTENVDSIISALRKGLNFVKS